MVKSGQVRTGFTLREPQRLTDARTLCREVVIRLRGTGNFHHLNQ